MKVLKRHIPNSKDRYEEFDINKIISAVKKAYKSQDKEISKTLIADLKWSFGMLDYDEISVEEIQNKVEDILRMHAPFDVLKAYVIYRSTHTESRLVRERLDYMNKYSNSSDNASSSSETDANANVSMKNVANLEGEVYKTTNRVIQRQRMKEKLNELYPEVAKQYEKDLNNHIIYTHDEASTPVLKPYTYSPYETVEVKYGDAHLLLSLQSLYNEVQSKEVLEDSEKGIWCKYPSNLFVKDREGWTKITRLTKKNRHRDLVRVKTAFGEDIVVTDNHPMIISDNKSDTKQAIESVGENQLRLESTITFEGINIIDLANYIECDEVYSNFITTRESRHTPYFYTKRFIKIDRSLGYVVGFFIGDGNYDNTFGNIGFTQKEKTTLNKLAEMLFESFGVVSYSNQKCGSNPEVWQMKVCSRVVEQVFRNVFKIKDKAENKCLPYNLLMYNEEFAKGIIEGLVDSDGTIQSNEATIQIRLSSRECITQLTKLLRYFGFGVANSHQSTPFGNNERIQSNYDIWGVMFTNTPQSTILDGSCKYQSKIKKAAINDLKYSTGWSKITGVTKIEEGSFLDKCNFIYDITTETNTFDCNNLWVHNCMAVTLYPLMLDGVGNIDGVTPSPPNDISSFSGQVTNLAFLLSSQCKGAVAFGDYFIALNYYVIKEYGTNWYDKLGLISTSECNLIPRTVKSAIEKGMKQFIWGINQPAGNRSYNSPFTNVSWYDKYYFESLFGEFYYPDGTQPEWKAIDTLQRMFMSLMREIRLIKPITFPVTTMALVHNNKEFLDKDYKDLCAEEWTKGGSFFCYTSDNPTSLASCCRVLNEMSDNTFSSTTGMTGVMTGSCCVITININRIVQNWFNSSDNKHKTDYTELREYLIKILDRVYKYHIAYKTMLYDLESKGMLAASNGGYIYMKKLYSTIGIIGYSEAAQFLGLKVSNNKEYKEFLQFLLGTIKDQNKLHSIKDKKKPFLFNSECIPGENLAVKLYNWDKQDGYKVPEDQNLYNCYFYNPWTEDSSVLDKIRLHGKELARFCDGGQACHLNLDSHLSKEQYLKLLDLAKDVGCNYFTFNIPISECQDCNHVVNAPIKECPKCHSDNISYYTRIIGYLVKVNNWSNERQIEQKTRIYEKPDNIS